MGTPANIADMQARSVRTIVKTASATITEAEFLAGVVIASGSGIALTLPATPTAAMKNRKCSFCSATASATIVVSNTDYGFGSGDSGSYDTVTMGIGCEAVVTVREISGVLYYFSNNETVVAGS